MKLPQGDRVPLLQQRRRLTIIDDFFLVCLLLVFCLQRRRKRSLINNWASTNLHLGAAPLLPLSMQFASLRVELVRPAPRLLGLCSEFLRSWHTRTYVSIWWPFVPVSYALRRASMQTLLHLQLLAQARDKKRFRSQGADYSSGLVSPSLYGKYSRWYDVP